MKIQKLSRFGHAPKELPIANLLFLAHVSGLKLVNIFLHDTYWFRLFFFFLIFLASWRSKAIFKELYIAWNYIKHKYRYLGRQRYQQKELHYFRQSSPDVTKCTEIVGSETDIFVGYILNLFGLFLFSYHSLMAKKKTGHLVGSGQSDTLKQCCCVNPVNLLQG